VHHPTFVDCVAGSRPIGGLPSRNLTAAAWGFIASSTSKIESPSLHYSTRRSGGPLRGYAPSFSCRLATASLPEQKHADDAIAHFQEAFLVPSNFQRTNYEGQDPTLPFPFRDSGLCLRTSMRQPRSDVIDDDQCRYSTETSHSFYEISHYYSTL
jgi:hypothetical protein